MDFTNLSEDSSSITNDSTLEVEAYVSVSTDNEELAGLFHELMDSDTVSPDCCMETVDISFCGCDESVTFDAGDIEVCPSGSILRVDLTLHDVCPNKISFKARIMTNYVDNNFLSCNMTI